MKPISQRQPVKTLVVYIDTSDDTIRHVRAWVLDPQKLELNRNSIFWKSGDIVAEKLHIRTVMDKLEHFVRSINETGTYETLPYVVFWDHHQQKILKEYMPTFDKLIKDTVILQDRVRDIWKYDLRVQGFSLTEVAEVMGIEYQEDCAKMAHIAAVIEMEYKSIAKALRKT
jgi:hypothetical protein